MFIDNSKTKAHWDSYSDEYYKRNDNEATIERIIKDPACAFQKRTFEIIRRFYPDLRGKKICVPSSGDNTAVFAFYLMGARVTSADISAEQIKNAHRVAEKHGWDIEFICQDSMDLQSIKSNEYDLVYTSNGVHVWISDLKRMYNEFNRILNQQGHYILIETHPFIRPFDDDNEIITVKRLYEDIECLNVVPNYLWRVQDFVNSLIAASFNIRELAEFHPDKGDLCNHCWWYRTDEEAAMDNYKKFDWKQNPWAALPQWLSICAQKQ